MSFATALHLDRHRWTPALILAAVALGFARMWIVSPGGAALDSQLEGGAFLGGVLGSALMPWAGGALAAYAHWFWCKLHRDRAYMTQVYPVRRRRVLHATVLILCLLMASEVLWRLALRAA